MNSFDHVFNCLSVPPAFLCRTIGCLPPNAFQSQYGYCDSCHPLIFPERRTKPDKPNKSSNQATQFQHKTTESKVKQQPRSVIRISLLTNHNVQQQHRVAQQCF